PSQPNTDSFTSLLDLKPAVFNPTEILKPGSYSQSVKRMTYAGGAKALGAVSPAPFSGETVTKSIGLLPAGESVTVMFSATINTPVLPPGTTQVCNVASISGSNFTTVQSNNLCTTLAQANLAVTKTDTPDPVFAGSNITYTVGVTNNGPDSAFHVSLTDAIPAHTPFVSTTTPAGWTRTDSVTVGGTGTLSFTKPSMINPETASFTIVVKVDNAT